MNVMQNFHGDDGSAASNCVGVTDLLVEGTMVVIDVTAVVEE